MRLLVFLAACGVGGAPDASGGSAALCDRYVACTAQVTPAGLDAVSAAYGSNGSCFYTLSQSECQHACATGLEQLRTLGGKGSACSECLVSGECLDAGKPVCDPASSRCVGCNADGDCSAPFPACVSHSCVACREDAQCSGQLPGCNPTTHTCVACTRNDHCPGGVCDISSHQCVACLTSQECPIATRCQAGSCIPGCDDDAHCPGDKPVCDSHVCHACQSDGDCPAGLSCDPFNDRCSACVPDWGSGCNDSQHCAPDGSCVTLTCADLERSCGDKTLPDGTVLHCGSCTDPETCQERPAMDLFGTYSIFVCALPDGSACDPRMPAMCGPGDRCVWNSFSAAASDVGTCVEDHGDCTINEECHYDTVGNHLVNLGQCVAKKCTPDCSVDAHCRPGEHCDPVKKYCVS